METRYGLTPKQVAVLRTFSEGLGELSVAEVAVYALLLPDQVKAALNELERLNLVRTDKRVVVLTNEGQSVLRGLAQFQGIPPTGTIVQLGRSFPNFLGILGAVGPAWLTGRQNSSQVEITVDESER